MNIRRTVSIAEKGINLVCKNSAKTSILRTKPVVFHGINPTLTYPPTGATFRLPRFCTVEMQQARKMNKIAIRQVKEPIVSTFTKASKEDLYRLTSETIEDSFSRVRWTNPKDGKVYHILKNGETEDGKIILRILDKDGAFVKEASVEPKVIAIPDNFTEATDVMGIKHGELVLTYARRSNPFARYVTFNISRENIFNNRELDDVIRYLDEGGKIDYLSCSYGTEVYEKRKLAQSFREMLDSQLGYDRISDRGVRVLCCSNNFKQQGIETVNDAANNILVINRNAEGVGSLNRSGKISDFSSSRNSELTQHYEVGEFTPRLTPYGVNITGLHGTDIPFPSQRLQELSQNDLLGKTSEDFARMKAQLDSELSEIQAQKVKLFTSKMDMKEIMKARVKLDEKQHDCMTRRSELFRKLNELVLKDGRYEPDLRDITGTSFSTPIRCAKLSLNDMLQGIL